MFEHFKKWIEFVNDSFNIHYFVDEIDYGDLCLKYNNKYYINKEPYNDGWIEINYENKHDIEIDDTEPEIFENMIKLNIDDENINKLINVITWDDTIKHTIDEYKKVEHLSQYFNLTEHIFSMIPDVQSELSIEYYPQHLFPFMEMENKKNEKDKNILFYNIHKNYYVLYGLDDTVNGIQIFDSLDEMFEQAKHVCDPYDNL